MRRHIPFCFGAILALYLPAVSSWAASVARFELGDPVVSATSVSVEVLMTLSGDAGSEVDAVAVSVFDSSLTAGNSDFSRFSFSPDPVTLSNWDPFGDINPDGIATFLVFDAAAVPLDVQAAPHRLGTVSVDLSGLAPGLSQFVTLAGGDPQVATNTDASGTVDTQFIASFSLDEGPNDSAFVEFGDSATFVTIPEPAALLILVLGLLPRRLNS